MQEKYEHALRLLQSLESMRLDRIICDITIHVGSEIFHVHRAVLAATSDYFKCMFRSGMKEAADGAISMKDVEPEAFKVCIDFMYTGETHVVIDNAEKVLYLSELLQIGYLSRFCLSTLQENLTVSNCLHLRDVSRTYSNKELENAAIAIVLENLESVISQTAFLSISEHDLCLYIGYSGSDIFTKWEAVRKWATFDESRKGNLDKKVRNLISDQSSRHTNLAHKMIRDPLVQGSPECKALISNRICQDRNYLERLKACEWFFLKKVAEEARQDAAIFIDIMAKHLHAVVRCECFLSIKEAEFFKLLEKSDDEMAKWTSLTTWVSYETCRLKSLTNLFQRMNFRKLPRLFIEEVVLDESMVRNSHECKDLVLRHLLSARQTFPQIAVFDQRDGCLDTFGVERNFHMGLWAPPRYELTRIVAINDSLYCILNTALFKYDNDAGWTPRANMYFQPENDSQVVSLPDKICLVESVALYTYTISKDSWSHFIQQRKKSDDRESQPKLGEDFCAAATAEQIYVMGGGHLLDGAISFTPPHPMYRALSKMTTTRYGAAAAARGEKIFVMGGWDGKNILRTCEFYSTTSNTWTTIQAMHYPRYRFGACSYQGRIFAVGGLHREDGSRPGTDTIEALTEHQWNTLYRIKKMDSAQAVVVYL